MRVVVLGGTGTIGRRVAAELVRSGVAGEVVVAGRDGRRAAEVAALLGGPDAGVRAAALDALDPALGRALGGYDVVCSCAGPAHDVEVPALRAAIEAGASYVSLCDDHPATEASLRLDGDAAAAGVTAITGCGLSPGITNLLVALAASELERVEEAEIAVAASWADSTGPARADHLLFSLAQAAPVVSDHTATIDTGGGGPRLVYFPEPVEWVETFRAAHPEVVTLPAAYDSLTAAEFRLGLTESAVMDAVRAGVALGLARSDRGRRRWLRLTEPVRAVLERVPPSGPDWTAARVDVHGIAAGRAVTVSLGVADHVANLATLPLAFAAIDVGTGAVRAPGVRPADRALDARALLARLSARGIRIARLEPAPV